MTARAAKRAKAGTSFDALPGVLREFDAGIERRAEHGTTNMKRST
jgi:hypothetical protein